MSTSPSTNASRDGSDAAAGDDHPAPAAADSAITEPVSADRFPTVAEVKAAYQPPMDPQIHNIQPGGGVVMSLELAWSALRRSLLRRFRPGYVRRMASVRQGTAGPIPFDPVDPRDVKYYRNQETYWWADSDDPYLWRDGLPFVRAGLAELILITGLMLVVALASLVLWWPLAIAPLVVAGLVVWFFRNPTREIPQGVGTVVSPADGKLVQIENVDDPVLGPCVQFGIFLSIFNVHVNRASLPGRVIAVRYRPGKMLNALRPESAKENENLDIIVQEEDVSLADEPPRIYRIRQITGQFARRIVCWVRPGDLLERGENFGMIKLGSRTELLVPRREGLQAIAQIGDKVKAGSTTLARYRPCLSGAASRNQNSSDTGQESPSSSEDA